MRYKVIVNPIAGRGYGARSVPQIKDLMSARGLEFDLVITTWAGEAVELARQAVLDGYETIVATGGDGTFNEVVNGMMAASDGGVIGNLGMLPVGSGSDFAWSAGVPSDLEGACAKLAEGHTRLVDVGRVTVDDAAPRYFDNSVGIGFEGVVTVEARKIKWLRGMALYLPVVLKSIFVSLKRARALIEYESEGQTHRLEFDLLMGDIYNGKRGGGAFLIAPQADIADGLLDLCLVNDIPRVKMLALVPYFIKGTHIHQACVTMLRSNRVVITSGDSLIAHTDGELICTDAHRIACEVLPGRVRVVC